MSIRNILLIVNRELRVSLMSKAVLITVLLLLCAVHGGIGALSWIDSRNVQSPVVLLSPELSSFPAIPRAETKLLSDGQDPRDAVLAGEGELALVNGPTGWTLYAEKTPSDATMYEIANAVESYEFAYLTQTSPQDAHTVSNFKSAGSLSFSSLGSDSNQHDSVIVLVGVLVLLVSITLFAARIGGRVTEEKSSSIVEILLSTMNPRDLLVGKIVSNLLLGVAVIFGILATVLLHLSRTKWWDDFHVSPQILAILVFAYLLGMVFFGSLYAAVGALVKRTEDLQTTQMPVLFLLMATMYAPLLGYRFLDSPFVQVLSWVPPFSIGLSPLQFVEGNMSIGPLIVVFLIQLCSTILVVFVSARVYRLGVTGLYFRNQWHK